MGQQWNGVGGAQSCLLDMQLGRFGTRDVTQKGYFIM